MSDQAVLDAPEIAVEAATATPVKEKPKSRQLPPYRVLLHNDDKNEMGHVVKAITELTPLKEEDAIWRMLEAHYNGLALLLVTHKERAELYAEQFASKSLTVTVEPA